MSGPVIPHWEEGPRGFGVGVGAGTEEVHARTTGPGSGPGANHFVLGGRQVWDKARWEAEWEGTLSQEVAIHLRRRRAETTSKAKRSPKKDQRSLDTCSRTHNLDAETEDQSQSQSQSQSMPCVRVPTTFDPLHLPSLFVFSLSLLGPLRTRLVQTLGFGRDIEVEDVDSKDYENSHTRRSTHYGIGLGLGFALVGAFCAGIGLGVMYSSMRFA